MAGAPPLPPGSGGALVGSRQRLLLLALELSLPQCPLTFIELARLPPPHWWATKKATFSFVFPGLITYHVSSRTRPSSPAAAEERSGACWEVGASAAKAGGVFSECAGPWSGSAPLLASEQAGGLRAAEGGRGWFWEYVPKGLGHQSWKGRRLPLSMLGGESKQQAATESQDQDGGRELHMPPAGSRCLVSTFGPSPCRHLNMKTTLQQGMVMSAYNPRSEEASLL